MNQATLFAQADDGSAVLFILLGLGFVAYQGFKVWLLMNKPDSYSALMEQHRRRRAEKWNRAAGGVGLLMRFMGKR
jgi:hypothetical protein